MIWQGLPSPRTTDTLRYSEHNVVTCYQISEDDASADSGGILYAKEAAGHEKLKVKKKVPHLQAANEL